ncbi:MAG: PAC2 family protein [Pirellula sp.]
MTNELQLNNPWFVAVWPGMGNVAVSAGFYLISKLEMHLHAEVRAEGLFDVEHVEVVDGIIQTAVMPRNRYFIYRDPNGKRDGIVFIGEAQPAQGKYHFCSQIAAHAKELGVSEITTFAAMATSMRPEHDSRVFVAATDAATLDNFIQLETEVLKEGNIGGLNGVLLGAAAEAQLHGACILGEMPSVFSQFPFPKASLSVLRVFAQSIGLKLDLKELEEQSIAMGQQLSTWLRRLERSMRQQASDINADDAESDGTDAEDSDGITHNDAGSEDDAGPEGDAGPERVTPNHSGREQENPSEHDFAQGLGRSVRSYHRISDDDELRIESLFDAASSDRSKAYELKRELDRLHVFTEYEDRFLDLFRQPTSLEITTDSVSEKDTAGLNTAGLNTAGLEEDRQKPKDSPPMDSAA